MVTLSMNTRVLNINTAVVTELSGEAYLNAKVVLKCCSELLLQWYVYFLCRFERLVSIYKPTEFTFLAFVM